MKRLELLFLTDTGFEPAAYAGSATSAKKNGAEGEIRTHGALGALRFSRPARSTAPPPPRI